MMDQEVLAALEICRSNEAYGLSLSAYVNELLKNEMIKQQREKLNDKKRATNKEIKASG